MTMSTGERALSVVAAVIAIFVFVTGTQSLRQTRGSASPVPAEAAARTDASGLEGHWDGYLSTWRQEVDPKTGQVTGEKQSYEATPSEEIIVVSKGDNRFEVTHKHKDGSFQATGPFTYRDGKLAQSGSPYSYYKGQIPTVWRTPDGTVKYIDGVCDLKLTRQLIPRWESFVGVWLIKSESRYLRITAKGGASFELSEGTGERSGTFASAPSGINWRPPVGLTLIDNTLQGVPPEFLEGNLILTLQTDEKLRYTTDFGGNNKNTVDAVKLIATD